jgi:Raf kinase inhibitor-like YbhB/YbcL family protein
MKRIFWTIHCSLAVLLCSVTHLLSEGKEGNKSMTFTLKSSAFTNGAVIPVEHTGDGVDVSPPLEWSGVPQGTVAFVLICDDPDAPAGTWVHWVLYDIPATITKLDKNVPKDKIVLSSAKHGVNDFGRIGYNGPAPPRGKPHRYFFKLYAVSKLTGLPPGATKQQVLDAIKGNILAECSLMGTYQRR